MSKIHVQYTNKRARRKPDQILATLINEIVQDYKTNDSDKNAHPSAIVLIGGPGGSGKSTVAKALLKELGPDACLLGLDDYKTSREFRASKNIFGPHPDANEMNLIKEHLHAIQQRQSFNKPVYNRQLGKIDQYKKFQPKPITIIEGEIATYKEFREFATLTIFMDAHWETLLRTRIIRDIGERGYDKDKTIATFLHSNLREFSKYGADSKIHADIHLYCDEDFTFYIESIEENIFKKHHHIFEKSMTPIDQTRKAQDIPVPLDATGTIDLKLFDELLNMLFHQGVHRIVVGSFCGEHQALNKKEFKILIQSACKFFPGEITCYIKASNLKDTKDLVHYAQEYGVDIVFVDINILKENFSSKGIEKYKQQLTKSNPHITFIRPKNISLQHSPVNAKKNIQKFLNDFPLTVRPPF